MPNNMPYNLRNSHLWIILTIDAILVTIAYFGSFLIRFEGVVPSIHMQAFLATVYWIVPVYLASFAVFNMYKGMWRYTSLVDSLYLIKAVAVGTAVTIIMILFLHLFDGFSRSVFVINGLLIFMLVGSFRICIRLVFAMPIRLNLMPLSRKIGGEKIKKLLIVGAGSGGEKLIRELPENRELEYDLVGLVDDDPKKYLRTLHGVPVLGNIDSLQELVEKYSVDEIAIAIPSATPRQMRRIVGACKRTLAAYKTVPGISEIMQGKVTLNHLRDVNYEDLLKRSPVELDNDLICEYLTDKCIMVTGGAGSIGSELCRQIASFSPQKLIIVERNESALYELVLDLQAAFPEVEVILALAAVQNRERMTYIFKHFKPQVVFHAAAYKHVPMMENHPWEAIFNNVVGSSVLLGLCHQFSVQRCVMVSTDKAVRPTNVMGASKRFVELLTQSYSTLNGTRFMAVRFGNVLGSVGSVLPLFKKQIAAGGPVTVTEPNMTRFFMTIPEACSLILQSGAYGKGGEIFVLKMGTPVRIDDMARDLISLSGFSPGEDIEIRYTGLRPGEKLYEELITRQEGIRPTQHEDIMMLAPDGCLSRQEMENHVNSLVTLAKQGNAEEIKRKLCDIIPEYCPWSECNVNTSQVHSQAAGAEKEMLPTALPPTGQMHQGAVCASSSGLSLYKVAAEDRLLLQLLAIDATQNNALLIEALPLADWEKIIQSALKHNVASLLYLRLRRAGKWEPVPLKIRKRLRKIYLYFVQASIRQQHWIGKYLALLNENNVSVMVLNGLCLGETIYRNIAGRPVGSVNLLFQKESFTSANRILKKAADFANCCGLDIDASEILQFLSLDQDIYTQAVWQRAKTAVISNCKVKVPCLEDLLLQLCLKLSFCHQFQFFGIRTLSDIRETLCQYESDLNWDAVVEISRELKVTNAVGLTLIMAKELLAAPVPTKIIQVLGAGSHYSIVKQFILEKMFYQSQTNGSLSPYFLQLWESRTLPKKARAFCKLLFPPHPLYWKTQDTGKGLWKNISVYSAHLFNTMGSCIWASVMMMAKDKEMLEMFRQQQQNTLIWEWLSGKKELTKESLRL